MPLEWSYQLFAALQSLLTSQLVLSLLNAQLMRAKELEGRREILRQKDPVIEKLVEKFKGGLNEVFSHGRTKKKGEWQGHKITVGNLLQVVRNPQAKKSTLDPDGR